MNTHRKNLLYRSTRLCVSCTIAAATFMPLSFLHAQTIPTAKEEITNNRYLAGSNYLDYDRQLPATPLTATPKGYEPFYMSHYGRHGSRWLIGENDYKNPLNTLRQAHEKGKLTPLGEETLNKLEQFFPTTVLR